MAQAGKKTPKQSVRTKPSAVRQKKTTSRSSARVAATPPTRIVKQPKYRSFKLSKRIKPEAHKQLSTAWQLFRKSIRFVKLHWRLFGGIASVYFLLNLFFGRGLSGINLDDVIFDIRTTSETDVSGFSLGVSLFGYLVSSAGGATTERGSTYQTIFTVIVSLVTIWAIRQALAGKIPTVKQAFYNGTAAVVPFVLVLLVVGLQLVPLAVGSWLYGTVVGNGIAVLAIERVVWALVFFLLAVLSLYMVCSSVFALYIVNLSGVTPMMALRSARKLVLHRRFELLRKILFLPFILMVLGGFILIPLLMIVPSVAAWLYIFLSAFAVILVHVYMYNLYRELL